MTLKNVADNQGKAQNVKANMADFESILDVRFRPLHMRGQSKYLTAHTMGLKQIQSAFSIPHDLLNFLIT